MDVLEYDDEGKDVVKLNNRPPFGEWKTGSGMEDLKSILIAVDDRPSSEWIAANGFKLGQQLNAKISLISVIDTDALMGDAGITPKDLAEIIRNDLKKSQENIIANIFQGYKIDAFIETGRTYEVILDKAEKINADLIILGTHGRTGVSHLLLGSVAEKVLRHSTKPVFVIPIKQ